MSVEINLKGQTNDIENDPAYHGIDGIIVVVIIISSSALSVAVTVRVPASHQTTRTAQRYRVCPVQ